MGKKRAGDLSTLRTILLRHVFSNSQIRILIFPVLLSIVVGKYFEWSVSECTKLISKSMDKGEYLRNAILLYLMVTLVGVVLTELQGFVFASAVQSVFRHTLRSTFECFINMDMEQFDSYGTGKIQSVIMRKSRAVSDFIEVVVQSLTPVVVGIAMVSVGVYSEFGILIALIVVGAVSLYAFLTISIALWRNRVRARLNKAENIASNIVYDSLANHEAVVSFHSYDVETKRYDESLEDMEQAGVSLTRSLYILNLFQRLIFAFLNSSVIALGVYGIMTEKMTREGLVFYITTSRILMSNLNNLGYTYCKFMEALLNAKEALSDDEGTCVPGVPVARFGQSIVFSDVEISYGDKRVLGGVSMSIGKGDRVAVVGANGSGKSTILKAFLKHHRYHGSIQIDGVDIQAVDNESFRGIVAHVPQNPSLFNETVMYNIKYGSPGVSDYAVVDLAKKFGMHSSIMRLERGYFTRVGECGRHISGGERQKIAVLRALLRGPEILVMDEPTSNLDKDAEHDMLRSVMKMSASLTVVAIVHNPDLLPFFNRVCLVEDGGARIVGVGEESPELLMEKLGVHERGASSIDAQ